MLHIRVHAHICVCTYVYVHICVPVCAYMWSEDQCGALQPAMLSTSA